jgi:hypothetical protein
MNVIGFDLEIMASTVRLCRLMCGGMTVAIPVI